MSTERWMQICCNDCGSCCEPVDAMTERELRKDLKQRFGWLSYHTEKGWRDVCPTCLDSVKGGK